MLQQMSGNYTAKFGSKLLDFVAISCYNSKKGARAFMVVTFCGHRDVYDREAVSQKLSAVLRDLIDEGANSFLLGGYGNFDSIAASVVRDLKKEFPGVRSTLVIPYLDREFNKDLYDDSTYPPLEHVPRRFAISRRNEWMVNQADVVVSYVRHGWGGAASTLRYAERKKKRIISVSDE